VGCYIEQLHSHGTSTADVTPWPKGQTVPGQIRNYITEPSTPDPLERALTESTPAYDPASSYGRALAAIRVLKRGHGNTGRRPYWLPDLCRCGVDWPCPILAEAAAGAEGGEMNCECYRRSIFPGEGPARDEPATLRGNMGYAAWIVSAEYLSVSRRLAAWQKKANTELIGTFDSIPPRARRAAEE